MDNNSWNRFNNKVGIPKDRVGDLEDINRIYSI